MFYSVAIQPHTSVYSVFCAVHAISQRHKTEHRALQWLFRRLCPLNSPRYQTDTSGYNTTCTTLERITAPQHLQRIPDTGRHAGRCAAQHSRPIIIRYISGHRCPLLWIHARRCSIQQTMQARRVQLLPCVDRWQVLHPAHLVPGTIHPAGQSSSRGAAGGAEPLAALAASLFGLSPDS